ncbi:hypothetical protein STTU_5435 [Streptomyces sp. Tu6071]|nr:hypothetical protein STTU_5435 [Streptomyces sp. Tu6071]
MPPGASPDTSMPHPAGDRHAMSTSTVVAGLPRGNAVAPD